MADSDDSKGLRFPCECVSAGPGGYSDPWADITKKKLLPNGTKEEIVNLVARVIDVRVKRLVGTDRVLRLFAKWSLVHDEEQASARVRRVGEKIPDRALL